MSAWPGGTWTSSPPVLPAPNRQANQAGFFGSGEIWSVGGLNGATFQFLAEVYHRSNGGPTPTPTPTPSPTATPSCTPIVVMGSIDTGDPIQTDRLFRSGIPQTCPAIRHARPSAMGFRAITIRTRSPIPLARLNARWSIRTRRAPAPTLSSSVLTWGASIRITSAPTGLGIQAAARIRISRSMLRFRPGRPSWWW